jgi:hypothetical protein
MPNSDLRAEIYKQSCEDHRFFGDMRFKQLTLWSVGVGFVLNALYGKEPPLLKSDPCLAGWLYVAAFFWTAVIWVMEVRSTKQGIRSRACKEGLEKGVVEALSTEERHQDLSNKWTLLDATNAVAGLYGGFCVVWTLELYRACGTCTIPFWGVVAVLVVLFAFTIREYWTLWEHAFKEWKW